MKKIALLFAVLFVLFFWPKQRDPFQPSVLLYDVEGNYPSFACPELEQIVAQPLTYLGHGRQAIAFESADRQHVVKFLFFRRFHEDRNQFASLRNLLPGHREKREKERWDSRWRHAQTALNNYDTAFRYLKEETGLVAVHLKAEKRDLPVCQVVDYRGKVHEIDLNRASFVVQRKAEERPWGAGDREAVRELLRTRARKGFKDRRNHFHERHVAFNGKKAIIIDPGNMEFHPEILADPTAELEWVENFPLPL